MNEELDQTTEQADEPIQATPKSEMQDGAGSGDSGETNGDDRADVRARDAEIEEIENGKVGNTPSLSDKNSSGILMGTVETFECDPEEDCPECQNRKVCQECQGEGKVTCPHCHGHRDCPKCNGNGTVPCRSCGGGGSCKKCKGSGEITCSQCGGSGNGPHYMNESRARTCSKCHGSGRVHCPNCNGGGHCQHCHGRGEVTCGECDGTRRCKKCDGQGTITCGHCDGSGNCPTCNGHGRVTCRRCQGTGFYQQYIGYKSQGVTKYFLFSGSRNIKDALADSVGTVLYNDVYKRWVDEDTLEFDRTKEAMDAAIRCDEPLFREFESAYGQFAGGQHPSTSADRPYNKALRVQEIPVTRVEYVVDDNPYVLYIMGLNSVVAYDEMPNRIEALRVGFFSRLKMLFTKTSRTKAYAKLAAYIFACDGMSIEESRLMNLAIKKLQLPPEKEQKFRLSLKEFTPSMPYKKFRKHVKALFSSKKTLAFAWQCMSIDKHVSEAETELFDKLLAEFKIPPEHKEKMKGYAARIASLSDKEIIDEYLHI